MICGPCYKARKPWAQVVGGRFSLMAWGVKMRLAGVFSCRQLFQAGAYAVRRVWAITPVCLPLDSKPLVH